MASVPSVGTSWKKPSDEGGGQHRHPRRSSELTCHHLGRLPPRQIAPCASELPYVFTKKRFLALINETAATTMNLQIIGSTTKFDASCFRCVLHTHAHNA